MARATAVTTPAAAAGSNEVATTTMARALQFSECRKVAVGLGGVRRERGCGMFSCVSSHRPQLFRLRSALARHLLMQRALARRPTLAAAMRHVSFRSCAGTRSPFVPLPQHFSELYNESVRRTCDACRKTAPRRTLMDHLR